MIDDVNMSRRQRKAQNELIDEMARVLDHAPSRKMLRFLIERCGVYQPGTPEDRRQVGLEIIGLVSSVSEHAYVGLMKEAADELVEMKLKAKKQQNLESEDDDY